MKTLSRTQRAVLSVLDANGRTHAYELKLRLKDVLGHSSVYAALSRAELNGYVVSEWGRERCEAAGKRSTAQILRADALGPRGPLRGGH